jgi:type I restriction enzyme R subunit
MSDRALSEFVIEEAALAWLESVGWTTKHGLEIAPGELAAERSDFGQVVLTQRLLDALARLNPTLPAEALDDAFRKLSRLEGPTLEARNRAVHRLLVDGVTVEYRTADGAIRGAQARVLDFDDMDHNDWLAVNQFTVSEHKHTRRSDVVLFVNGLPLALIELKNAADEDSTIWSAFQQLQTYQAELPTLFAFNAALVVSDGVEARIGTLTAGREWFKPWRTISGERLADPHLPELQVMLEGVFDRRRLLDLVRHFIVFEDAGGGLLVKKLAGYHQFHAVNVAVTETLRAAQLQQEADRVAEGRGGYEAGQRPGGQPGDRRIGVVWHTQGSGKSLTMAFYAGRVIREPRMANPTIVVLTDRNDLDDQLFGTFSRCQDLLHQPPVQAESRAHLRELLCKLLSGEIHTRRRKNVVQARSFAEMLEQSIRRYQNRAIEAAQVIEELIGLAKDMRAANARGEALGLGDEELAFYDALEVNDSAVQVLGEPTLKTIARELTESVRRNVSIDWTVRENVRAQMRVRVRRILRKYGYPPDKQEQATQTVLQQAEVLSHAWAAA